MADAVKRIDAEELEWEDYISYFEGDPFTGVAIERRPDGSLWSEQTYAMGVLDGISRDFHENGALDSETMFKLGIANGTSRAFYPSGKPKFEKNIELGYCLSSREYDESGTLVKEQALQQGDENYRLLEAARAREPQRVEQIKTKVRPK